MRTHLLATAAMAAVMTLGAGSAQANWDFGGRPGPKTPDPEVITTITEDHDFSNDVDTHWDFDVDFSADIDFYKDFKLPDVNELVNVSVVQKQFGDVKATTELDINAAEGRGGYEVTYKEVPVKGDAEIDAWPKDIPVDTSDLYVDVPVYTLSEGSLPVVLASATAVGNMASISLDNGTSTTGLLLNSDQIVADAEGGRVDIDAEAKAYLDGVAVKLDATAVANMLSVNAVNPSFIGGSIMQTSYGDVTATAKLDQDITGSQDYDSFAGLDPENISGGVLVNPPEMQGVIASVSATAVGNMVTINTGSYASTPTGIGSNISDTTGN